MRTIALLFLFAVLLIPIVTLTYTAAVSTFSSSPNQEGQTPTSSAADHGGQGHRENSTPEVNYFLRYEAGD